MFITMRHSSGPQQHMLFTSLPIYSATSSEVAT